MISCVSPLFALAPIDKSTNRLEKERERLEAELSIELLLYRYRKLDGKEHSLHRVHSRFCTVEGAREINLIDRRYGSEPSQQ